MPGECEVCCGRRTVRLALYRPVAVEPLGDGPLAIDVGEMSREYPCPECSAGADLVRYERVGVVKQSKDGPERLASDERFLSIMRRSIANEIGVVLLERGYISFQQRKADDRGVFSMQGRLDVIEPGRVTSFEERVAERQLEVAAAVVAEAEAEVANWGSFYGVQTIDKFQAVDGLRAALRKVKAKYAK